MEITVRHVSTHYKELRVLEGKTTIESGLLSDLEAFLLGVDLFEVARELLGEDGFKVCIRDTYSCSELFGGDDDYS